MDLERFSVPAPGFAGYTRMISRVMSVLPTIRPEPASLFSASLCLVLSHRRVPSV